MARYTLALLCLIGLTTNTVFSIEPTVYVQIGKNLELGQAESTDVYDVTNCDVTLSNGTKVSVYPESNNEDVRKKFSMYSYDRCRVNIFRLNEQDAGKWTVQTTIKKGKEINIKALSYNVKVRKLFQKKAPVPSERTWVYPDQLVSVHFSEKFDNLESCKILNPKQLEYDLESDSAESIKSSGQCGFKMVAKKEFSGRWTLIADLKNNTAFYTVLEVIVKDDKELHPEPMTLFFKRAEETVFFSLENRMRSAKMCYLVDPRGVKYPMQTGSCSYSGDVATEYHDGAWKAYYGLDGLQELVELTINVRVYDLIPFNSTVSHSSNGDINLLCQVRSRSLKYCSFVRPDGEVLHMTFGVGNEKYEYYGNGSHSHTHYITETESVTDCGVTIHKPDANDYGSWRCLVKVEYEETLGRVLKVTPPARSNIEVKSGTTANDVYVKRGDQYKIKCTTDEMLSYCWLRSPNGTVHSVLPGKNHKTPVLEYAGTGLEFGDCTALVKDANDTHNGKWSCHMGIKDGPEIETSLNVIIEDTHLMAASELVLLESHSETDLVCRPLPNSNKVIESCRWVNPLGHGINVERQGRYYTETGTTHCKLSIRVINYEEDAGQWSCYARFAGSHEEGSANMIVTYRASLPIGTVLSIGLCISSLITVSIGIFAIVVYKRRIAALRDFDEKIILEKPGKYP